MITHREGFRPNFFEKLEADVLASSSKQADIGSVERHGVKDGYGFGLHPTHGRIARPVRGFRLQNGLAGGEEGVESRQLHARRFHSREGLNYFRGKFHHDHTAAAVSRLNVFCPACCT